MARTKLPRNLPVAIGPREFAGVRWPVIYAPPGPGVPGIGPEWALGIRGREGWEYFPLLPREALALLLAWGKDVSPWATPVEALPGPCPPLSPGGEKTIVEFFRNSYGILDLGTAWPMAALKSAPGTGHRGLFLVRAPGGRPAWVVAQYVFSAHPVLPEIPTGWEAWEIPEETARILLRAESTEPWRAQEIWEAAARLVQELVATNSGKEGA